MRGKKKQKKVVEIVKIDEKKKVVNHLVHILSLFNILSLTVGFAKLRMVIKNEPMGISQQKLAFCNQGN